MGVVKLMCWGKFNLHCQAKNTDGMLEFAITISERANGSIEILGLDSCEQFNPIKRVNTVGLLPFKDKGAFVKQNTFLMF